MICVETKVSIQKYCYLLNYKQFKFTLNEAKKR